MTIRNVLFIGTDQMRADVIGPEKTVPALTPNLDAFLESAARYERAYSSCPLCTPSRASMFTGDHAFRHGMGTNCDMYHALSRELADPSRLLHHDLLAAGYRCGFLGKWHVGCKSAPSDFGFEGESLPGYGDVVSSPAFLDYLARNGLSYEVEPTLCFNPKGQTMSGGRWKGPVESTPSYFLSEQAKDLLSGFQKSDQPFFATVQYWDPHSPHLISEEFYGITDRSTLKPWGNFHDDLTTKPRRVARERDDFYRLHPRTEAEVIEYIGLYCDHMAMLDQQIGRLLDWLEESGLAKETLVIFTSDHGDMTGAHGGLVDKGLMYEEALRVPLAFRHPDIQPGLRETLACTMDVMPTALDLLGLHHMPRDGVSLAPSLRAPNTRQRSGLLIEYHGLRFLYSQRAYLSDDSWKFVFNPGDDDELYDLNTDPIEMKNLATDPIAAKDLARLRQATIAEMARLNDPLRDCIAKFNGMWRTGSGQFDATAVYADASDAHTQ